MAVAHRVVQAIGAGLVVVGGLLIATYAMTGASLAQTAPPTPSTGIPLGSLKTISVQSPDLSAYVQDDTALLELGKALFWDMQVGSDGTQACATCHFQAGADVRWKNTLSPAVLQGKTTWQIGGPNYQLKPSDYPFHKLADISNNASAVISDTNTVTGSEGVFATSFNLPGIKSKGVDDCTQVPDPTFNVGGIDTRRVTGRNAPSAINAVFNFRNFWDGRAQNNFNGVNPFGDRDPNPKVFKNVNGKVDQNGTRLSIPFSSLASQAVGPPGSPFEMSCDGRIFPNIGRKMLLVKPLGQQQVAKDDSVLGPLTSPLDDKGLTVGYADLIQTAFRPEWWNSLDPIQIGAATPVTKSYLNSDLIKILGRDDVKRLSSDDDKKVIIPNNLYLQMEANFSLFFGLAIQRYETSLVANDSPVDQYYDGNASALTASQQNGMAIFMGPGKCMNCHGGPETTNASVRNVTNERLERMHMGDGSVAVYDDGFYNIGVRPTADDVGVGGTDKWGNPLSETALCQNALRAGLTCPANVQSVAGRPLENLAAATLDPNERIAVQGSFKAPGLRNVELTGPYFHNGSKATLRQVVDFYSRGGDFPSNPDLDVDIEPILIPNPDGVTSHRITDSEKDDLVNFLVGLTDARVKYEKAPFDHPQLCMPNGEEGSTTSVSRNGGSNSIQAKDSMVCVPATGKGGRTQAQGALQPFLGLDPHSGSTATTTPPPPVTPPTGGGTTPPPPAPPPAPPAPPNTPPLTTGSLLLSGPGLTNPISTWRMGTHMWVSDELTGLCRIDQNPDLSLAVNLSTCNNVAPGRPAFDPTTNFVYVTDKSKNGIGAVWRLTFDPTTQTIGQAKAIATLGATRPFSAAIGSDHKLYIGQLKSPNIVRIDPAAAAPSPLTIGQTSDGQGVTGIAFVGSDLYLGQTAAVSKMANALSCAGTCVATVTPFLVAAPSALAADASGALYAADTPAPSGGTGPSTIRRYRLSTGTQDVLATAGTLPDGTSSGFFAVGGLWADPSGALVVGDRPVTSFGRLWTVVPPA